MNYTKLPNELVLMMPDMGHAELRVIIFVLRESVGWQRREACITFSQFQSATGLSRQGVRNGISEAIERGILVREVNGRGFCYRVSVYEVDSSSLLRRPIDANESLPSRPTSVHEVDHDSKASRPPAVNEVDRSTPMLKKVKERTTKERKEKVGGYTNPPTNGAESPKAKPQPKRENASFDLLSEMGVADTTARELIQLRSFEQIRRQVFGWLKERLRGKADPGLLVYRIRKDAPCAEPDPEIDRKLWDRYRTAEEQAAEAEAQCDLAEIVDRQHAEAKHRNGAKKARPAAPKPSYADPWAVVVAELTASGQFSDGILQRAHAEMIGEKDEAQVWQVSLAMRDAPEFTYMQRQGAVLIRKTLTSVLGRAVLVDVIVPEAEVA